MARNLAGEIIIARKAANREKFGTIAWEMKMETVRELVRRLAEETPKTPHTSVDGDIWN